jgi:uncharacterized protein YecE (DUF72 family)
VNKVWIGTSGWHYKHWLGKFYPPKWPSTRMLEHYVGQFDTVELNNTFYRLPSETSLIAWRNATPSHFRFAVKASRFLTHMKKLKDADSGLQRFLDPVRLLEPKLGPILFQLPPFWEVDLDRLATFLQILPSEYRYAFEFRNGSWNGRPLYQLLRRHDVGYCIFDLAGTQSPVEVTCDFAYIRLHGPGGKYQGSYDDATLESWASKIKVWKKMKSVYVYFDNDDSGFAPKDALRLKELVSAA